MKKQTAVADKLASVLGVANDIINDPSILPDVLSDDEEHALATVPETNGQLVPLSLDETMDTNLIEDYRQVRETLQNLVKKGESALNGIILVANGSDSARDYEVVSMLIKTIADTSKELLGIQKTIREMQAQAAKNRKGGGDLGVTAESGSNVTVNNQTLVVSSDNLHEMLMDLKKKGELTLPVPK